MKGPLIKTFWSIRHRLEDAIMSALKEMGITKYGEHFYCDGSLSPDSVIVDLGANAGAFSMEMATRYRCSPILIEPNPELLEKIDIPGVQKINAVIAANNEPMVFYVSENPEASSLDKAIAQSYGIVGERIVDAMSLETLMDRHQLQNIDLLKVDIEGAEIDMFNETSSSYLKRCRQITVEFHDYIDKRQRGPAKNILWNVSRLGFKVFKFSTRSYGRVLMINTDFFRPKRAQILTFNILQAIAVAMDYLYFKVLVRSKVLLTSK